MEAQRAVEVDGDLVRALREKQCWNQKELAQQAHLALSNIYNMEKGRKKFLLYSVRKVAEALGVLPETLVKPRATDKSEALQRVQEFDDLLDLAEPTTRLWPVPAPNGSQRVHAHNWRGIRGIIPKGLGPPQTPRFHRGSHLCVATEFTQTVYLVLLDKGPDGLIYCLCPSWLAPRMRLEPGEWLPQHEAREPYTVFVAEDIGREYLVAITTERPLELDWQPADSQEAPARCLDLEDIATLKAQLLKQRPEHWQLHKTYFDVTQAQEELRA